MVVIDSAQTVLPAPLGVVRGAQAKGPRKHIPRPKAQYLYLSLTSYPQQGLTTAVSYGTEADENSSTTQTDHKKPFPDQTPSKPLPIIIRATNGKSKEGRDKRIKLSTIVEIDALEPFFTKYAEVCKLGMSGLKKRDRSKAKEKLKAKKRKQQGAAGLETKKE